MSKIESSVKLLSQNVQSQMSDRPLNTPSIIQDINQLASRTLKNYAPADILGLAGQGQCYDLEMCSLLVYPWLTLSIFFKRGEVSEAVLRKCSEKYRKCISKTPMMKSMFK